MRKLTTTKKNRKIRKTPYIFINGVKATTYDVNAFWKAYRNGTDKFTLIVDKNGDFIITSKED